MTTTSSRKNFCLSIALLGIGFFIIILLFSIDLIFFIPVYLFETTLKGGVSLSSTKCERSTLDSSFIFYISRDYAANCPSGGTDSTVFLITNPTKYTVE